MLALSGKVVNNTPDRIRGKGPMIRVRWIAFLGVMMLGASAFAEDPPPAQAGKESAASKAPDSKPGRKVPIRVFDLGETEVKGKIQKPLVLYVIDRGQLKYKGLPLERSLLDEVKESVEKPPF